MRRIFHANSELMVLKTLTENSNSRKAGSILASLNTDSFHTIAAKECFKRIKKIAEKRSQIPSWDDLLSDPTLLETTRDRLTLFKKKPLKNQDKINNLLSRLQTYRRMRLMWYAAANIDKSLKNSSVDDKQLLEETTQYITKAQTNSDTSKWFTNIGAGPKDLTGINLLKRTLKVDSKSYIPTGFRSYDAKSIGIPRGTFMINATQTGGGKSVMAGQLSEQMAVNGAKVCLVPLEMNDIETQQRQLARLCDIPMADVLHANDLNNKQKKKIKKQFKHFAAKVHNNGGLLSYFIPDEDLTMEELLLTLKPYKYDVIIIDYVGLLKGVDGDDQWRALGRATRVAKRYAAATSSIVMAFAQLSKENEIRYSKTMVEHANAAWFWSWDETIKNSGIISIQQPKSRNQSSFAFYLRHDFAKMRFISLSAKEERLLEEAKRIANDNKKGKGENDNKEAKEPERKFQKVSKKLTFFAG